MKNEPVDMTNLKIEDFPKISKLGPAGKVLTKEDFIVTEDDITKGLPLPAKRQPLRKILPKIMLGAFVVGIIAGIANITFLGVIAGIVAFVSFAAFFFLSVFTLSEKENTNAIKNDAFKIYEDEIYDAGYSNLNDNGHCSYHVYGKMYGRIHSSEMYCTAEKGTRFYFVLKDEYSLDKVHRPEAIIAVFPVGVYELSEELKEKLVPYDEQAGEIAFQRRIKEEQNILKNGPLPCLVECSNCGKTFSLKKEVCPSCSTPYTLTVKDVVEKKEWYQ